MTFDHAPGRHHEVRGHRLWVEAEGTGEPLLLLAGLGPAGSHVIFHPFFSGLAGSFRVIYVDLYGRGRSEAPGDLADITFAGDVADVAALLVGVGPAHVYGFSYGGLLGQALALDHPELVRSLIIANSLHSPEMWQANHANINAELARQHPDVWDRITALRAAGLKSTDPAMAAEFAHAARLVRFCNPGNAALLANEPGARNVELYPVFVGADVDFIVGGEVPRIPDFRPRLKEIGVPVMVLAGRYDRALYPSMQRQFTEFGPQIRLEFLERSGSFSHVEEPEAVFALVREFTGALRCAMTRYDDVVDLERYPIHDPAGPAYPALVRDCREQLRDTGVAQLGGFLTPAAVSEMLALASQLAAAAWASDQTHTVYFEPADHSAGLGHPRALLQHSAKKAIAYDQIPAGAPIRRLYESGDLTGFIAAVLGKDVLYRSADPLDALEIAIFGAGDELGWHFDNSEFSVTVMYQQAEAGGHFDYVPRLRTGQDQNYPGVREILHGGSDGVVRLPGSPGTLAVFRGQHALHRVTPVSGPRPRINSVLTYGEHPEMRLNELTQKLFYGRTA